MPTKRTIDSFFGAVPAPKRRKEGTAVGSDNAGLDNAGSEQPEPPSFSTHETYPFPIKELPDAVSKELQSLPARPGKARTDQPDLDIVYYEPYIPAYLARTLFHFLRSELPFYRVKYTIKRGGIETQVNTPRYTTVFGLDETSRFDAAGRVVDARTGAPLPSASASASAHAHARLPPRPIPSCLDGLRRSAEVATACRFNVCLVNYYASGADAIAFHSDDERFLGPDPAIASFSLGAARDFLLKRKPVAVAKAGAGAGIAAGAPCPSPAPPAAPPASKPLRLRLGSGDMILMRGPTQSRWLHSVPKRSGRNDAADGGRINITFRRALVKAGTDNYYHYNVGKGPVYRWDAQRKDMVLWEAGTAGTSELQLE